MSIALMSAAFRAQVSPTQKLVLLALCDCANDMGECYPSIPLLEGKTSLSERAVQGAVQQLEAAGLLRRELRPGRATVYWMTPAVGAPPQQMRGAARAPTPAAGAPPPPQHVHHTPAAGAPRTIKEPSVEPSQKRIAASTQPSKPPPFSGDENLEKLNGKQLVPLADGWELPETWGVDAEALGWKPADVLKEAEKFRQYWVAGKGAGKHRSVRGWRQSWSNWLTNAERYKR